MDYQLFIGGKWVNGNNRFEVRNKYNQETIGTFPTARQEEVDEAVGSAQQAAQEMADMPAHRRSQILSRTAAIIQAQREDFAKTIAAEAGKALKYAHRSGPWNLHLDHRSGGSQTDPWGDCPPGCRTIG